MRRVLTRHADSENEGSLRSGELNSGRGRISAWAAAWYNGGVTKNSAAHVGINGQLLSGAHSYRSAGVSGYIRQLLAHLPAAAPDLHLTAFTPDIDLDLPASLDVPYGSAM